jgi:hypothetical protein
MSEIFIGRTAPEKPCPTLARLRWPGACGVLAGLQE